MRVVFAPVLHKKMIKKKKRQDEKKSIRKCITEDNQIFSFNDFLDCE